MDTSGERQAAVEGGLVLGDVWSVGPRLRGDLLIDRSSGLVFECIVEFERSSRRSGVNYQSDDGVDFVRQRAGMLGQVCFWLGFDGGGGWNMPLELLCHRSSYAFLTMVTLATRPAFGKAM